MKPYYLLLLAALPVHAEELPSLPLFTALCTASQAAGFAAEGGGLTPAALTPSTFTVRKIDPDLDRPKNFDERSPCNKSMTAADNDYSYATGCYVISTGKRKTFAFADGRECIERFKDGEIQAVYCDTLSFLPNGNFVKVPNAKDVEPLEIDAGLLKISVGKCSVVEMQKEGMKK